jgi:hypothetical protein
MSKSRYITINYRPDPILVDFMAPSNIKPEAMQVYIHHSDFNCPNPNLLPNANNIIFMSEGYYIAYYTK